MATQTTKILDITRSFVPVDPNAFPNNYIYSATEDKPETDKPIVIYSGYNFMPASYGYKSFFGVNTTLDIDAIPSRVDEVFIIQSSTLENIAVALCEDGIWTKKANTTGAWTHSITLAVPTVGTHYNWTYCIISNELYCYRAQAASYFKFSTSIRTVTAAEEGMGVPPGTHPKDTFYAITPNFLNMAGQQGIFKAGGRLGFWDSLNSIAWSNIDDFADFTPSVTTLSGSTIFQEITGVIVNILASGDGFIVYATKSITHIARSEESTNQWEPTVLLKDTGISFARQCCSSVSGTQHFAYTQQGLYKIEKNVATEALTEIVDFLEEGHLPIYLSLLEGRYLFLEILDSTYLNSLVTWHKNTLDAFTYTSAEAAIADLFEPSPTVDAIAESIRTSLGLPAKAHLSTYTPVFNVAINDTPYFKSTVEELPSISHVSYDRSEFPQMTDTLTYPMLTDMKLEVGTRSTYSVVEGGFTFNFKPIHGKLFITPVADRSRVLSDIEKVSLGCDSISGLAFYQTTKWAANDAIIQGLLGYIAGYTDTGHLGTYSDAVMPPFPEYSISEGSNLGIPDATRYQIYGTYAAVREKNTPQYTMDTAWSVPATIIEGNSVRVRRHRRFITTIFNKVEFTKEFAYTSPAVPPFVPAYDNYASIANSSFFALAGNTEALVDNLVQEATATKIGYSYLDVDGIPQFLPDSGAIVPHVVIPATSFPAPDVVLPATTFFLQDGSIGPIYPTIAGALVYDLALQKWGKMKQDYKVLVEWSPVNIDTGDTIGLDTFGLVGGAVLPSGKISLFDKYPVDSYIKIGKIGYSRQGVTSAQEVRVFFRTKSTGLLRVETSIDSNLIDIGLTKTDSFTNTLEAVMYPSTTGRWHNVCVIGTYDIMGVEFRGFNAGNR